MPADPSFPHNYGQSGFYRSATPLHREYPPVGRNFKITGRPMSAPQDSAADKNHASNSLFARTTLNRQIAAHVARPALATPAVRCRTTIIPVTVDDNDNPTSPPQLSCGEVDRTAPSRLPSTVGKLEPEEERGPSAQTPDQSSGRFSV